MFDNLVTGFRFGKQKLSNYFKDSGLRDNPDSEKDPNRFEILGQNAVVRSQFARLSCWSRQEYSEHRIERWCFILYMECNVHVN
jgi:hypothetical protein